MGKSGYFLLLYCYFILFLNWPDGKKAVADHLSIVDMPSNLSKLICMESETDQLKKRDLPYISDAAWSRTPCTTLHCTILLQPFAVPKART
jgi:hypothetical protein